MGLEEEHTDKIIKTFANIFFNYIYNYTFSCNFIKILCILNEFKFIYKINQPKRIQVLAKRYALSSSLLIFSSTNIKMEPFNKLS